MSSIWLSVVAALIVGSTGSTDPIDGWVVKLSADPTWINGKFPKLDLPASASTDQVVAKVLQMSRFPGKEIDYKILEIKEVHIDNFAGLYTAVLLEAGSIEKVVLLKYEGMWWRRILSVP